MTTQEKTYFCPKCEQTKNESEFMWNLQKNGCRYKGLCRSCQNDSRRKSYHKHLERNREKVRERSYKALYGMTIEDYNKMLSDQSGGCKICGERPEKGKRLEIDHNHDTGKVRGLLCRKCNLTVVYDNPAILRKAIEYLERNDN